MSPENASPARRGTVLAVGGAGGVAAAVRAEHDLQIAMTAAQALDLARSVPPPDLVLVDLEAAGVAGVAACKDLKRGSRTSSIPVVVVAVPTDPLLDDVEAIVDGILPKPVDAGLLLARVRAALSAKLDVPDRAPPLRPGTIIGSFRVDAKLGSGAFGDVYSATNPSTSARVAIKVLAKSAASHEPELVARFVAEARAASRIQQQNIIEILSFGVHDPSQQPYFVMELLEGETLRELVARRGRLPIEDVLPIVRAIAAGLDAAHAAGVTHRDLKPDNVFLARRGSETVVKVLDFGIAKLSGDDAGFRTRTGVVLGTPRYMSPEQARGRVITPATDVYALGVMVHEMLTGAAPFSGSALDVLVQHATEAPPKASAVCAAVASSLDAPILRMLAKRPEARPASAGEAVRALAEAAGL